MAARRILGDYTEEDPQPRDTRTEGGAGGGFNIGGLFDPPPEPPPAEPPPPDPVEPTGGDIRGPVIYPDPTPADPNPPPTVPTPTPNPGSSLPPRAGATNPPSGGGVTPTPTNGYLKSLLDGGLSPQDAIAKFNKDTGRSRGNEAVYYANNNTIGLPEGYFAGGDGGWVWVVRRPESTSGPSPTSSANSGTSGVTRAPFQTPAYGGPSSAGIFGAGPVQQVGQDPLSLLISGKLAELIGNNGRFDSGTEALNLENVRQAADRARKSELSGAESELASRGLLPVGGGPGLLGDALSRIESNDIAPLFSQATRDYQIHDADLASGRLMDALQGATNRQIGLSDIAIKELEQNRLFNQFLATFGLERDKVLYDLQSGQDQSMLTLLTLFLQLAGKTQQGYI